MLQGTKELITLWLAVAHQLLIAFMVLIKRAVMGGYVNKCQEAIQCYASAVINRRLFLVFTAQTLHNGC